MASESLTNEKIAKRFPNQFEMVNYLIGLAQKQVKRGHEPDGSNIALEVISDVRQGFDLYARAAAEAPALDDDDDGDEEPEKEQEDIDAKESKGSKKTQAAAE